MYLRHGLEGTIRRLRSPHDFPQNVRHLPHKASRFLGFLRQCGAPVQVADAPWTPACLLRSRTRGPHKSAIDYHEFLYGEMADMAEKGQWLVLPYDLVQDLPGLRLSPIGVVPQHSRRPRTIVDYSFNGVNAVTLPLAPKEAMQFGRTFLRLLHHIGQSDPAHGPPYIIKVDISDGFYRIHVNPSHAVKLGVAFPSTPDKQALVAFPMVLPMGWVNSPPVFCAATETIADLANRRLQRRQRPEPSHRLEDLAAEGDNIRPTPRDRRAQRPPLGLTDVYVDDFIMLGQGSADRLQTLRRMLFECVDQVFRPLQAGEGPRQEPISVKKLRKGDASWDTRKEVLGWIIDTVARTIELPARRQQRLRAILDEHPSTRGRVSVSSWHRTLGELRSMSLAVPGLRGMFSTLQDALKNQSHRIRLTRAHHDFLADIRWLANDLDQRPTDIHETYPGPALVLGATDACSHGMGGVFFAKTTEGDRPFYWRSAFPPEIRNDVVSWNNPKGGVTNSDLELAATIAQHDVVSSLRPPRHACIFTATDNTPALGWQLKGSASTTGPTA